MTKVSIIIPAYNEAATIIELLRKVSSQTVQGFELETIVVDDGSRDETVELLRKHPGLYTILVERKTNGGKGAAIIDGLNKATGEYVLFQDADLEYDPDDYAGLLAPIARFDADVVMGSRLIAPPITRVSYFWHKVGNRVITFLFNILNNTTFTDVYSCYLVYRRSLVEADNLRTTGWQQQAEILTLAVSRCKRIYEVPISYHGRTYEDGKKIRAHHIFGVIVTMITTAFRSGRS